MAKRRSLWKSISTSEKVARELPTALGWRMAEFGQLLYTWLIPHCDDFGRFSGTAFDVKARVMPLCKRPLEQFERVLQLLDKLGLVRLYEVNGKRYLYYPDWEMRQKGLNKRTKSQIPDPPPPLSGKFREVPRSSENSFHEVEEEGLINPPKPPKGGGECHFEFEWTAETAAKIVKQAPQRWQATMTKCIGKLVSYDPFLVLATLLDVKAGKKQPKMPWTATSWIVKRLAERKTPSQGNYDKAKELLRRARSGD